jgi:hypothetical protein
MGFNDDQFIRDRILASTIEVARRLRIPDLFVPSTQVVAVATSQQTFAIGATVQSVVKETINFINSAGTRSSLTWTKPVNTIYATRPSTVFRIGALLWLNVNDIAIGEKVEFGSYSYPTLPSDSSQFSYPELEEYVLTKASASIVKLTNSDKATDFENTAGDLWRGILVSYSQDQ